MNEWWSLDEALEALPQLAELGVAYCEQPLPAGDRGRQDAEGALADPDLRRRGLPHASPTSPRCAEIAHGINIKLAKSGGIREAIRMAHAARALGLGVMLGCMVESGLGIAAGCAVAPLCDHVDLDGNLLLAEDPWPGVAFIDGVQVPSERAGARCRASLSGCCSSPRASRATRTTARPRAACSRYGERPVVAMLDSTRAGETQAGVPIVGDGRTTALCFGPTTALVGVATQGGRFPPAWRELLKSCIANGLHIENGLHEFLRTTRSWPSWRRATASSCATCAARRPTSNVPTGANLDGSGAGSCSPSARTARSGR